VVVLTAHAEALFALRAAEAGASGFIPKDVRIARIVGAVRAVRAGEVAVDPTVLRSVLAQAAADAIPTAEGLPADQQTVLGLLAQGAGSSVIAEKLSVEVGAAREIVAATVAGLGARSPFEALVLAARRRLLTTELR
jgi:DNA-binding NarL/FixJ family response regulator